MAIHPSELVLTDEELSTVRRLEQEIDESLKRQFVHGRGQYKVYVGRISQRITNELIRRYTISGWKQVGHNSGEDMFFIE